MKLLLGNIDYEKHTTSEGNEFQRGLEHAGWTLAGVGFGDDCRDVPTLLARHKPDVALVHDKRDWDPASGICFRKGIDFQRLGELAKRPDIKKLAVVKDAGSSIDDHRRFCEEIAADAVVTYYHEKSVLAVSPWLKDYSLIRNYHTVDARLCASIELTRPRQKALVSGAVSNTYPLRQLVIQNARQIGVDIARHPGYGNKGSFTPSYLKTLSQYKVHIASCSNYAFALRKIVESVAMGATPITNLPEYDRLPEIDSALVRISSNATVAEIKDAVSFADSTWNIDERLVWAAAAQRYYDYRASGERLSASIDMAFRRDRVTA